MTLSTDDRAISTAVTSALTVAITGLLITGLLIGSNQLITDQRDVVIERGLEDVGGAVTSEILRLDSFNTTQAEVALESDHPEQIAGYGYDIEILDRSSSPSPPYRYTLYLNSSAPTENTEVPVRFRTTTEVCPSVADSGTVELRYSTDTNCITIGNP